MIDYHLHTPLCLHATGSPEEYAGRAVELGIPEIGFSDHCPMPPDYDPEFRMKLEEYPEYVGMVSRCGEAFPQLKIKLGLEADYHPGTEDFVRNILGDYDFDYVIGSIHFLGDWGFDNPDQADKFKGRDVYEIYEQYFDLVVGLARTGLFDILGHPDVIKKFGHRPEKDWASLEKRALKAVAKAGMALDINTAGLRRPAREIYPRPSMLKLAREMDIGITFGSDAHRPEDVGKDFDAAVALAREAGYTHFRSYTGRHYELVKIPE